MNKTEILNIVNEPSKHIHIVKIDGKDTIVYSSKFVELLELIPTMVDILDKIKTEIIAKDRTVKSIRSDCCCFFTADEILNIIDKYKVER